MEQSVVKASESGLTQPRKEEERAVEEVHLTDDKHKICDLPQCSPSLIMLYLQGNYELTAIHPSFFHYRTAFLQVLDLSHTSIKSLPKSLPKLVALKKLQLRGCCLFMELSPQVGKLKNLEELDLDETQIMDLPREIGKLLKLRHLRISFYPLCGKKKSKSNILIDPKLISNLLQLTELSIDVDPTDKRWDDCVEAVVKEVRSSKTLRTLSLYLPKFQLLDYTSIIYSSLSHFRFTVGSHRKRIISRVPQEVEAEFRNWDKCLKFVNGENIPIEIKEVLKYSTSFFLDHHRTAMNLSEFGIENMKRLKFCLLAECNNMEILIDGKMHSQINEDNPSESGPGSIENVLESLEHLSIYYMENLGSIWRGANSYGCMSKLKFLELHTCPKLNIIFSHSLLENFSNLEEFILEDCPQVTSLVGHASVKPVMSDKIFLPSLKRLLLLYLPELVTISNGLLIAPKLESIGFYNCPKLRSISKMELSSKRLKMIKGECRWWEAMNWNETEWGDQPDYLMRIFSPVNNDKDVMTQMAENTCLSEGTVQNESRQLDDEKLPKVSAQDDKSQCSEEKTTGTDMTKSTSSKSMLPSTPWIRASDASEQSWSYSSEKVWPEVPEIWNCTRNQNKGVIHSVSETMRSDRTIFRARSDSEVFEDGFKWKKYGRQMANGTPRDYYRCLTNGCPVRKKVERDSQDTSFLIITYQGKHNHFVHYFKETNRLSQVCHDNRANNMEDASAVAKTISPTKGNGDVSETSLQDNGPHPEYTDIPGASVQDESQSVGKAERMRTILKMKGKRPTPLVVPSAATRELKFAAGFLNQKCSSSNEQRSISPKGKNFSHVHHLSQQSFPVISSTTAKLSATTLPTLSSTHKADFGEDVPNARKRKHANIASITVLEVNECDFKEMVRRMTGMPAREIQGRRKMSGRGVQ
ncbi:hypothetical protein DITRI_Ditri04bG0035100 [Diplodiscus trichospermus]